MAAEALLGAAAQVVFGKLLEIPIQEMNLLFGYKDELQYLKDKFEIINGYLIDAAQKKLESTAVRSWLRKLEDVAYEAENLFDELEYERIRRKVGIDNQMKRKGCLKYFCFSNPVSFRSTMAHKVKAVKEKLKKLEEMGKDFGLTNIIGSSASSVAFVEQTDAKTLDPIFVGRENEKSKIIDMLITPSNEVISVIPIVGMGGLGKTTLARQIFNDPKIVNYFDKMIWVSVSENFDSTKLFRHILEELIGEHRFETRNAILKAIQEKLKDKKYLLVLDDLWNENSDIWETFHNSLTGVNSNKGNFILVTTRTECVASNVSTDQSMHCALGDLTNDSCWSIIQSKAFYGGEAPEELKNIGKEIAQRCGGHPLAANVVGGTLRGKGRDYWNSLLEGAFSYSNSKEDRVMKVLEVSFNRLPSPLLKKCFAYCSIFPKDEQIDKDRLIQLWMAEGFLNDNKGDMESQGNKVFEILLHHSFFQEAEKDLVTGNIVNCKMHDLMHDLACLLSNSENLNGGRKSSPYRYLVMDEPYNVAQEEVFYWRTLIWEGNVLEKMFQNFQGLHTLVLKGKNIKLLSTSLEKLIHLRLLDVSYTDIDSLPVSVCKLFHMQTLRVDGCYKLHAFPEELQQLINMRHLHLRWYQRTPVNIGKLTSLRTLNFFNLEVDEGRRIEELGGLTNLSGELTIRKLDLVRDREEAGRAKMIEKPNLKMLKLQWSDDSSDGDNSNQEEVLDGLQPHQNIRRLIIENFMGDHYPSWTMKMTVKCDQVRLDSLIQIELINCNRCTEISTLGTLPLLEILSLEGMEGLQSIGPSFYHNNLHKCNSCSNNQTSSPTVFFPSLKSLKLTKMPSLVSWVEPDEIKDGNAIAFPVLEILEVSTCPLLSDAPIHDFPSLKHCDISDVSSLQFSFVQSKYLTILELKKCPRIITLELPEDAKCLKKLSIEHCENLSSISNFNSLPSLTLMWISNCKSLTKLPSKILDSCISLEELSLVRCIKSLPNIGCCGRLRKLEFNPIIRDEEFIEDGVLLPESIQELILYSTPLPYQIQHLTSLKRLELFDFGNEGLPEWFGKLSSLQELTIDFIGEGFKGDGLLPLLQCHSLSKLELCGSDSASLPCQIQLLTSLKELILLAFKIEGLPEWFGNLSSLQELNLQFCSKLKHLPSKEAMVRLTKLQTLDILCCPLLEERLKPEEEITDDSQWPNISHIPKVFVNFVQIN